MFIPIMLAYKAAKGNHGKQVPKTSPWAPWSVRTIATTLQERVPQQYKPFNEE